MLQIIFIHSCDTYLLNVHYMLGSIAYIGDSAGGSEQSLNNSLPSWGLVVRGSQDKIHK